MDQTLSLFGAWFRVTPQFIARAVMCHGIKKSASFYFQKCDSHFVLNERKGFVHQKSPNRSMRFDAERTLLTHEQSLHASLGHHRSSGLIHLFIVVVGAREAVMPVRGAPDRSGEMDEFSAVAAALGSPNAPFRARDG
jgi:hypothetical protein